MQKRKLEELNLPDDFLFGSMVNYPGIGEEFGRTHYDDGARTLFLYTRGSQGNPPKELRQLMRHMEDTTLENAGKRGLETDTKDGGDGKEG